MTNLPILSILIFLPLIGTFVLMVTPDEIPGKPRNVRAVALLTSLVTFSLSLVLLYEFDPSVGDYQFVEQVKWLPFLNSSYHVGIDGISVLLVLLSTFLTPIAILSSWNAIRSRVKEYMMAFLLLETMMIGTFCALDLILFYLFFEGVLIPMYLIIGIWGGPRRVYSAFKFFLYTLLGSVLMLVAILVIYHETGSTSLEIAQAQTFDMSTQKWLWLAFFASFAVKVPMWPVHTWLPDAHVEAPTAGSVILAAILLKMGGYGFLRFSLPLFPEASQSFAPFVFVLSIIAVVYTSLVALAQKDMKKLIAYSSVAHMGIVTFGIFSFSLYGVQGSLFQMLSHGLVSGALFLCVGVLYDRLHTREIDAYGGVVHKMPTFAVLYSIFTLASVGLPGTTGFVGEILVLLSAFKINGWMAFGLGTGMILGAAYALWLYRRLIFGAIANNAVSTFKDLNWIEKSVLIPVAAAVLLFGVYPKPILAVSEPAVQKILSLCQPANKSNMLL